MSTEFDIDFLAVGEAGKSGDAIAIRFDHPNPLNNNQVVIVVDGGFAENGVAIVGHINSHFGTNRVDLVVSTHLDSDHINGLRPVVERMEVGEILLHLPWRYVDTKHWFGRPTVTAQLRKSLDDTIELVDLIIEKQLPLAQPFAGLERFGGAYKVLGPSEDYYASLVPEFGEVKATPVNSVLASLMMGNLSATATLTKQYEDKLTETLSDDATTSPKNNSSVISELLIGGRRIILTGDAGGDALNGAWDYLEALYGPNPGVNCIQIPHHGSRRNVSPAIMNRMLGAPGARPDGSTLAIASAAKDSDKHPAKQALNAFSRRGCNVYATQGHGLRHYYGAERSGWSPMQKHPIYSVVEDD